MYDLDKGKQQHVVNAARALLGIHEVPDGSNSGPGVRMIQSATKAYGEPWCVSTVQYVWREVFGHTLADDTANAYYLADWALKHAIVIPVPVVGCPVVYHIGDGHAGIVCAVGNANQFHAVEGNEQNAVRWVARNPAAIRCTFILPPDLHALPHVGHHEAAKPAPAPELVSERGHVET